MKPRVLPPDYDDSDMDFMLVFLYHAYTVNNVDLVTLNSHASLPFDGQDVKAIGWGDTTFMGNSSDVLHLEYIPGFQKCIIEFKAKFAKGAPMPQKLDLIVLCRATQARMIPRSHLLENGS